MVHFRQNSFYIVPEKEDYSFVCLPNWFTYYCVFLDLMMREREKRESKTV
jgi:hypothetical protein